jgi:DNA polymerase III delta prime subunit
VSARLFHGPTSREAAVQWADDNGRLLTDPFGDDGLKVDTSREIVELLSTVPIGDRIGTVVIGPMDGATPAAADALLKTLEELPSNVVLPALWAEDIGSVIGTIRSRTDEVWCPPNPDSSPDGPYLQTAEALCEAALRRRIPSIIETLKEHAGSEDALLRASCVVLSTKEEWPLNVRIKLWESLREVLCVRNPTPRLVLAAYLV